MNPVVAEHTVNTMLLNFVGNWYCSLATVSSIQDQSQVQGQSDHYYPFLLQKSLLPFVTVNVSVDTYYNISYYFIIL